MKLWQLTKTQLTELYTRVAAISEKKMKDAEAEVITYLSSLSVAITSAEASEIARLIFKEKDEASFISAVTINTRIMRNFSSNESVNPTVSLGRRKSEGEFLQESYFLLRPRQADIEGLQRLANFGNAKYVTTPLATTSVSSSRESLSMTVTSAMRVASPTSRVRTNKPYSGAFFANVSVTDVKAVERIPVETFLHQPLASEIVYIDSNNVSSGELDKLVDLAFPLSLDHADMMDRVNELRRIISNPAVYENFVNTVIVPDIAKGRTTFERKAIVAGSDALMRINAISSAYGDLAPLLRGILFFMAKNTGLVGENFVYTDIVEAEYPSFGVFGLGHLRNIIIREELKACMKDFIASIQKQEFSGTVIPGDIQTKYFRVARLFARDLDSLELIHPAMEVAQMVAFDALLSNSSKMRQMKYLEQSVFASFLATNYEFVTQMAAISSSAVWVKSIGSNSVLSTQESSLLAWLDRRFASIKPFVRPIEEAKSYVACQPLGGKLANLYTEHFAADASVWVGKIVNYGDNGYTLSTLSREGLAKLLTTTLRGMQTLVAGDLLAEAKKSLALVGSPDFVSFAVGKNTKARALIAASYSGEVVYELLDFAGVSGEFKIKQLGKIVYPIRKEKLEALRSEMIGSLVYTTDPIVYLQFEGFQQDRSEKTAEHRDSLGSLDARDIVFGARFANPSILDRTFTATFTAGGQSKTLTDVSLKELLPNELVEFSEVHILNSEIGAATSRLELLASLARYASSFNTVSTITEVYSARILELISDIVKSAPLIREIAQHLFYRIVRQWMFDSDFHTASLAKIEENRLHNQCIAVALELVNSIVKAYSPELIASLIDDAKRSIQWSMQKM